MKSQISVEYEQGGTDAGLSFSSLLSFFLWVSRNMAKKQTTAREKKAIQQVHFTRKSTDGDARIRQADRLARPLSILKMLSESNRWTKQKLAEKLECSVKTVERTIKVLELSGIPILLDSKTKNYRLQDDCVVPMVRLSVEECLDEVRDLAVGQGQSGAANATRNVRLKSAKVVLQPGMRQTIETASALTSVLELKNVDHSTSNEVLRTIQIALATGRQLKTEYFSPYNGQVSTMLIHPYRLCFIRCAWYLVGRPSFAEGPHNLRVVRFRSVSITNESASIPEDFDLEQHLGQAWGVFKGITRHEVSIRFWGPAAHVVTETRWHRTQKVERHEDGTVILQFEVDGLDEILWWLMSWAPFARVEKPIELREQLVTELANGIKANS